MSVKAIESRRHYNYRRREEALYNIMTTRIQQLSDQARVMVPKGIPPDAWIAHYNQIFARLIIDDCVKIMHEQERIPAGFVYSKGVDQHQLAIKQHFGVAL